MEETKDSLKFEFVKIRDYYNPSDKTKLEFELYRTVINNNATTSHHLGIAIQYGKTEPNNGYIGTMAKIRLIPLYDYLLKNEMSELEFINFINEEPVDGHIVWNYRTGKLSYNLILYTKSINSSFQYNKLNNNVDYILNMNLLYFRNQSNYIRLPEDFLVIKAIESLTGYKKGEYSIFSKTIWDKLYPNIVD